VKSDEAEEPRMGKSEGDIIYPRIGGRVWGSGFGVLGSHHARRFVEITRAQILLALSRLGLALYRHQVIRIRIGAREEI